MLPVLIQGDVPQWLDTWLGRAGQIAVVVGGAAGLVRWLMRGIIRDLRTLKRDFMASDQKWRTDVQTLMGKSDIQGGELERVKKDVNEIKETVKEVEKQTTKIDKDLTEVATDVKHILKEQDRKKE